MKINNKKVILMTAVLLAIAIIGFLWASNNWRDYIIVTEDRGNICTYDSEGKLSGSSLAAGNDVKVNVPKAKYEQYKNDAIASNKCFH